MLSDRVPEREKRGFVACYEDLRPGSWWDRTDT